jgi:ElaB/YqjD/DUF883 family membrane-anchored ribosome-binding protein
MFNAKKKSNRFDIDNLREQGEEIAARGSEIARYAADQSRRAARDAADQVKDRPWVAAAAAGAVAGLGAAAILWSRRRNA